ncbi:MAG: FCD domain-containing protein [Beutenbergiaceae bacterium]
MPSWVLAVRIVAELDLQSRHRIHQFVATVSRRYGRAAHGDLLGSIDADIALHLCLAEAAGNAALVDAWRRLEAITRMSIMHGGAGPARSNMATERHRTLVEAIITGGSVAEAAVMEHVESAVARFFGGQG